MDEHNSEPDFPELPRRTLLQGLAATPVAGAMLADRASAHSSPTFTVSQPNGITETVTPLNYQGQDVVEYYGWNENGKPESNTPNGIEKSNVSQLFFYEDPPADGEDHGELSLVVLHDSKDDLDDGRVTFEFPDRLPQDGAWDVRDDDPGNDSYFGRRRVEWKWNNRRTDGGAYRGGFDEGATVTIDPDWLKGIDKWVLRNGFGDDDIIELDMEKQVTVTVAGGSAGGPDLTVERARPVQVVFDADPNDDGTLDLVKDKATAVLVSPGGEDLDQLSSSVTVRTEVRADGSVASSDSTDLDADEYRSLASAGDFVELRVDVPETGVRTVRTTVDADDAVDEPDESNAVTETVSVAETDPIDLAYYRVTDDRPFTEFGEPSQQAFETHTNKSDTFIQGTFPVAESDYSTSRQGTYDGTALGGVAGLHNDLANLDFWAWADTDGARGVGVTNEGYWDFHDKSSWRGATSTNSNAFLVAAGYWVTTAHELGHQLGLHTGTEEYDLSGRDRGSGYWVARSELVENRTAFMEGYVEESFDRWVSNEKDDADDFEDFDHMFRQKLSGSVPTTASSVTTDDDADVLYLRGLVTDDGTVDRLTTDFRTEGELRTTDDGDYAVVAKDADGAVVTERSFALSFRLHVADEVPRGPFETDTAAFSFPMRYPADLRTLELRKDGETLTTVRTTTDLLHDAIDRVPGEAFRQKGKREVADERRQALHNKVDAVERMLAAGNERGARKKLRRDLEPAVDRWLKDDHETTTPDDVSKAQLLSIIERHVERLR